MCQRRILMEQVILHKSLPLQCPGCAEIQAVELVDIYSNTYVKDGDRIMIRTLCPKAVQTMIRRRIEVGLLERHQVVNRRFNVLKCQGN